jgi:uncharacterized membrane protein HdeD (DUF308 family)
MSTLHVLNAFAVLLVVAGAVATVVGLAAQARGRWPGLFTYGVVMLVFGVLLLVLLFMVGASV